MILGITVLSKGKHETKNTKKESFGFDYFNDRRAAGPAPMYENGNCTTKQGRENCGRDNRAS